MSLHGNSLVIEDSPEGLDPTLAAITLMKRCISSGLASNQPLLKFPRDRGSATRLASGTGRDPLYEEVRPELPSLNQPLLEFPGDEVLTEGPPVALRASSL